MLSIHSSLLRFGTILHFNILFVNFVSVLAGNFTFLVKLEKSGDIYFMYKTVRLYCRFELIAFEYKVIMLRYQCLGLWILWEFNFLDFFVINSIIKRAIYKLNFSYWGKRTNSLLPTFWWILIYKYHMYLPLWKLGVHRHQCTI